jgi:hypothetical protein
MPIYNKFPEDNPVNSMGEAGQGLFSHEQQFSDFELPPGYINPRLAIREAVQHLEAYEPSRVADIATGMIIMVAQWKTSYLRFLMDALEASPVCADTADARLESLQFLNSHDREQR